LDGILCPCIKLESLCRARTGSSKSISNVLSIKYRCLLASSTRRKFCSHCKEAIIISLASMPACKPASICTSSSWLSYL
uniref:Ovule protein n=1 Tax=Rodentolepis nana TaxID=102285 RepID=A0A0R3TVN1_RODNA